MARRRVKRRGADLGGMGYGRRTFKTRSKAAYKKGRRMAMKKRRGAPSVASPQKYTTRINLYSTSDNNIDVNNSAAPSQAIFYTVYNIKANAIEDLTARSLIYNKFKIVKIKYNFTRTVPAKIMQGINYATVRDPCDFDVCFANTFNRLLPTPTESNQQAIQSWAMQQTGSKKLTIGAGNFSKSVRPLMIEEVTMEGPSGTTNSASVAVKKNVKMPWLDLNNDLLDNISLGQLVYVAAPKQVLTSIPLGTGGEGSNGMSEKQVQNCFVWDVTADVTYMVKGRYLDKSIVDA